MWKKQNHAKKNSWNQLFSNVFIKNIDFTEKCCFFRKTRDRIMFSKILHWHFLEFNGDFLKLYQTADSKWKQNNSRSGRKILHLNFFREKEFIVEWHQPRRKFKKENTSKGKLHLWLSFLALQIYWQLLTNNRHSFLRVVHAFKNYGRDSKKRLDRTSELNIWVYIDSFDLTNLLFFSCQRSLLQSHSNKAKKGKLDVNDQIFLRMNCMYF